MSDLEAKVGVEGTHPSIREMPEQTDIHEEQAFNPGDRVKVCLQPYYRIGSRLTEHSSLEYAAIAGNVGVIVGDRQENNCYIIDIGVSQHAVAGECLSKVE